MSTAFINGKLHPSSFSQFEPPVSLHGDCLNLLPALASESIDLVTIDPPYLTTREKWDKKEQVTEELSKELFRIAKETSSLYVWCGIGEKSQSLLRWFPIFAKQWHFKDLITWKKQRGIGMRRGWLYTREEIMWFVKDNGKYVWNVERQYLTEKRTVQNLGANGKIRKSEFKRITNVWDDIEMKGNWGTHKEFKDIKHFTPKPIAAMERIIRLHTKEGDTVLDCFMGSGTTGVACVNTKRRFIGIEKEEKYFNIASKRIADALNVVSN